VELGDDADVGPGVERLDRGPHAGAARTDDDNVVHDVHS
jgi:hypothetical protein